MNGNFAKAAAAAAQAAFPASNGVIPQRIQLKRVKGFNLQAVSQALNGLPAVAVTRPGKWGNPYRLNDRQFDAFPFGSVQRAQACVDYYRRMVEKGFVTVSYTQLTKEERGDGSHSFGAHKVTQVARKYLAGKNLACHCPLDRPCHADVLLELANGPEAGMRRSPEPGSCEGQSPDTEPALTRSPEGRQGGSQTEGGEHA